MKRIKQLNNILDKDCHDLADSLSFTRRKIKNRSGESIAETLVALLISSLALVMLAGAITASAGMIKTTRSKLSDYYEANEYIAKMSAPVSSVSGLTSDTNQTIVIAESTSSFSQSVTSISYLKNDVFTDYPVVVFGK